MDIISISTESEDNGEEGVPARGIPASVQRLIPTAIIPESSQVQSKNQLNAPLSCLVFVKLFLT